MITVVFSKQGRFTLGVKTDKGILDVEAAAQRLPQFARVPLTVSQLLSQGEEAKLALASLAESALSHDDLFYSEEILEYGPCVPEPQKIICSGLNYKKHAEECNLPFPSSPLIFSKCSNTLSGHRQYITLPQTSTQVDYEAELAIVIGKQAKNVPPEEALSYVYGYCSSNDLTARDLQFKSSQWLLGKTCDGFCPIGPYLVSHDEVGNPNELWIRCYVNGELRQDSTTSDMIFSCEEIISYLSCHMTLYPGDIILTGTPSGVIMGYPEEKQVWLQDGDEVSVEIEKLGRLTNIMKKY